MGMAAILIMWPRCGEQTFIPLAPYEIWLWLAHWFLWTFEEFGQWLDGRLKAQVS